MKGDPAVAPDGLHCFHCGYDLRGQQVGGRCPECGESVAASMQRLTAPLPTVAWEAAMRVFLASVAINLLTVLALIGPLITTAVLSRPRPTGLAMAIAIGSIMVLVALREHWLARVDRLWPRLAYDEPPTEQRMLQPALVAWLSVALLLMAKSALGLMWFLALAGGGLFFFATTRIASTAYLQQRIANGILGEGTSIYGRIEELAGYDVFVCRTLIVSTTATGVMVFLPVLSYLAAFIAFIAVGVSLIWHVVRLLTLWQLLRPTLALMRVMRRSNPL